MQHTTYPKSIKASVLAKVMAPNAPNVVELPRAYEMREHIEQLRSDVYEGKDYTKAFRLLKKNDHLIFDNSSWINHDLSYNPHNSKF